MATVSKREQLLHSIRTQWTRTEREAREREHQFDDPIGPGWEWAVGDAFRHLLARADELGRYVQLAVNGEPLPTEAPSAEAGVADLGDLDPESVAQGLEAAHARIWQGIERLGDETFERPLEGPFAHLTLGELLADRARHEAEHISALPPLTDEHRREAAAARHVREERGHRARETSGHRSEGAPAPATARESSAGESQAGVEHPAAATVERRARAARRGTWISVGVFAVAAPVAAILRRRGRRRREPRWTWWR